jgi:hypothetical protein
MAQGEVGTEPLSYFVPIRRCSVIDSILLHMNLALHSKLSGSG